MFMQVRKLLTESTKDIKGAKIENNKFCVSVHYRNVEEEVLSTTPFLPFWFLLMYKVALNFENDKNIETNFL